MKAVTCPQCGSLISKVSLYQTIVQCDYCGAKVLLNDENAPPQNPKPDNLPAYEYNPPKSSLPPVAVAIFAVLGIGVFIFIAIISLSKSRPAFPTPKPTPYKTPTYSTNIIEKENNILLEFGGKGTGEGLFDDPNGIVVGGDGSIYVSDATLRVQRFDASGKFLNLWNVKGDFKKEAIEKLAVAADGTVYVLIGGEIVLFNGETGEQKHVLTDSRKHYIDDFVLRGDGGMMYVAENETSEEFVQTKGRAIVNRFVGIHTKAADADIPPEGIKIAVDGKGDFYAVYALGALYGEHNYDDEDLMTFHFSPQGKFLNKFAVDLMPSAIAIDNQSRIYILDNKATVEIVIYTGAGSEIKRFGVEGFHSNAMAIDKQNCLYVVSGETIRKLKAID